MRRKISSLLRSNGEQRLAFILIACHAKTFQNREGLCEVYALYPRRIAYVNPLRYHEVMRHHAIVEFGERNPHERKMDTHESYNCFARLLCRLSFAWARIGWRIPPSRNRRKLD